MSTQSALAAAAALVALALAMSTYERWLGARRRHELAWTVSLAMFFIGAATLWFGAANGWDEITFRIFYLFGAVVNVPFLALGTVYLLGDRRRADRWTAVVALASAFAAGVMLEAPMHGQVPVDRLPQGSEVFGALPRVLAAVASGVGAMVVLGGAGWSAFRFWRGRRGFGPVHPGRPPVQAARRLAGANVLIATGTLVLGAGGLFNSVLDAMEAFAVTLLVGIALLFAGFLVATSGPRPRSSTGGRPSGPAEEEPVVERVDAKYS